VDLHLPLFRKDQILPLHSNNRILSNELLSVEVHRKPIGESNWQDKVKLDSSGEYVVPVFTPHIDNIHKSEME
jgi:hypothetical protein